MYVQLCSCNYVCLYVGMYVYVCLYVCEYVCILFVCMYVFLYACCLLVCFGVAYLFSRVGFSAVCSLEVLGLRWYGVV